MFPLSRRLILLCGLLSALAVTLNGIPLRQSAKSPYRRPQRAQVRNRALDANWTPSTSAEPNNRSGREMDAVLSRSVEENVARGAANLNGQIISKANMRNVDGGADAAAVRRRFVSSVSTFWQYILFTVGSIMSLGLVAFLGLITYERFIAEQPHPGALSDPESSEDSSSVPPDPVGGNKKKLGDATSSSSSEKKLESAQQRTATTSTTSSTV